MPLYEYICNDCQTTFERLIAAQDRDKQSKCPECGSNKTRRLISGFAIGKSSGGGSQTSCPTCTTGTCNLGG